MGIMFSGAEIVEMGVEIEKNGRDFYREVSACAKNETLKSIFDYLEKEEERHIEDFKKILASVRTYEPEEAYTEEYFAYMKALADDHVFTKENSGCELGKKTSSGKEAMDTALKFEKDSVLFYEGMKKAVSAKDQVLIDSLIAEEQKHIMKLTRLRDSLKKNPPEGKDK